MSVRDCVRAITKTQYKGGYTYLEKRRSDILKLSNGGVRRKPPAHEKHHFIANRRDNEIRIVACGIIRRHILQVSPKGFPNIVGAHVSS